MSVIPFPKHQLDDCAAKFCTVCGGVNEGLPTHCPGDWMPEMLEWMVYKGAVDYHVRHGWYQVVAGYRRKA